MTCLCAIQLQSSSPDLVSSPRPRPGMLPCCTPLLHCQRLAHYFLSLYNLSAKHLTLPTRAHFCTHTQLQDQNIPQTVTGQSFLFGHFIKLSSLQNGCGPPFWPLMILIQSHYSHILSVSFFFFFISKGKRRLLWTRIIIFPKKHRVPTEVMALACYSVLGVILSRFLTYWGDGGVLCFVLLYLEERFYSSGSKSLL